MVVTNNKIDPCRSSGKKTTRNESPQKTSDPEETSPKTPKTHKSDPTDLLGDTEELAWWADMEDAPTQEEYEDIPPTIAILRRRGDHPQMRIYNKAEVHEMPPKLVLLLCCGTQDIDMEALGFNNQPLTKIYDPRSAGCSHNIPVGDSFPPFQIGDPRNPN